MVKIIKSAFYHKFKANPKGVVAFLQWLQKSKSMHDTIDKNFIKLRVVSRK